MRKEIIKKAVVEKLIRDEKKGWTQAHARAYAMALLTMRQRVLRKKVA